MEEEGAKQIEVVAKDDKRQITAVLQTLQQEIFEGKTAAFHSMISLKHGTLQKHQNTG